MEEEKVVPSDIEISQAAEVTISFLNINFTYFIPISKIAEAAGILEDELS